MIGSQGILQSTSPRKEHELLLAASQGKRGELRLRTPLRFGRSARLGIITIKCKVKHLRLLRVGVGVRKGCWAQGTGVRSSLSVVLKVAGFLKSPGPPGSWQRARCVLLSSSLSLLLSSSPPPPPGSFCPSALARSLFCRCRPSEGAPRARASSERARG